MLIPLALSHFLSIIPNNAVDTCPRINYPGAKVGTVTDPQINEASGLVASQTNPGIFWTLNDSQGPVCIYALAANGSLVKKVCLEGAENFDWEAIATAPCDARVSKAMCLYIGDIGDNSLVRDHISIYRLEEPNLEKVFAPEDSRPASKWQVFHFKYPDDLSFNAESLMIDSKYRELVIVTKSQQPPYSLVFKAH